MTKAEEAALKAYPVNMTPLNYQDLIEQFGGKTEIDVNTYPRCQFQEGYEQAEKDLAQDFHADTLIGDKDYAVFHADVEDLNGDLYNYCQEQGFMGKVKVIIVEDPG